MTTQEIIDRIDTMAQTFTAMLEPNDLPRMILSPRFLSELPRKQFLEVCEHYSCDDISLGRWPIAWVSIANILLRVECERIEDVMPKKNIDDLRALIANEPQTA